MSEYGMRPSIEWMKEYFKGRPVAGVELGVFKGINAERLLSMLNIKYMNLYDLWITPGYAKNRYDYNEHYKMVMKKYGENNKIGIIRMDTVKGADLIKDNSLDFIYIDADHSYKGCKRDLEAWYPKLKKGGVIIVHDYHCCVGVRRAVTEFLVTKLITLKQFKVFDAIGIHDKVKYGECVIIK